MLKDTHLKVIYLNYVRDTIKLSQQIASLQGNFNIIFGNLDRKKQYHYVSEVK